MSMGVEALNALQAGMALPFGGDRLALRPGARETMIAGLEVWAAASRRSRDPLTRV